jgi:hypothetical protein
MEKHLHRSSKGTIVKFIFVAAVTAALLVPSISSAQAASQSPDSTKTLLPMGQPADAKPAYPHAVGYLSFIFPLVTVSNTTTFDFSSATTVGFPIGVNVLYSDKFGFSYEITPNIKATTGPGATSKLNDILFDPGVMFRFQHGFTLIPRFAFDTNGRYGFTPVFNQVYLHTKDVNYFVALSLPARFGNSEAASIGLNLQIGFIFN